MKFLKYSILFFLGIFLISNASAMVVSGLWQNGANSMVITNGQSASFTLDFGYSPATITATLYNSANVIVWQKQYSLANVYTMTDTIPSGNLSVGNYQLSVIGTNNYGTDTANALSLTVNAAPNPPSDTIPPIVTLVSPSNNFKSGSSAITFNGIVSDNVGIANVSLYGNFSGTWGIKGTYSSNLLNNTNYQFSLSLPNGTYLWNYRACDASGNCAFGSANRILTVNVSQNPANETIPPSVTINSPLNQIYNTHSITFNITATDASGVSACTYSLDSGNNITMASAGNHFYTNTNSSMTEGSHIAQFYCRDIYNNLNNTAKVTFTIDTTLPVIQFVSPTLSDGSDIAQNYIPVNITASDSGSGLNNIAAYLYDSSGNLLTTYNSNLSPFSFSFTGLNPGTYSIKAVAFDNAGNSNPTETRTITLYSNNYNPETNSNYSYIDVYQNQYLQQLNKTSQGITLAEKPVTSNSFSLGFAILLFEILLVLVLLGLIIFVFAKKKFND